MLEKQLEFLRKLTDFKPDIALVLGSGLGGIYPISPFPLRRGTKAVFCLENSAAKI